MKKTLFFILFFLGTIKFTFSGQCQSRAEISSDERPVEATAIARAGRLIREQHDNPGFTRGIPDDLLYLSFVKAFEPLQKDPNLLLETVDKLPPELLELFLNVLAYKKSNPFYYLNESSLAEALPEKIQFFSEILSLSKKREVLHSKVLRLLKEMTRCLEEQKQALSWYEGMGMLGGDSDYPNSSEPINLMG
ncbi:hypothetical protein KAW80_02160 [Candidatus Babeliales bacterium]|nr:hypothetical protein [Candidatus Babeliales bacterium]